MIDNDTPESHLTVVTGDAKPTGPKRSRKGPGRTASPTQGDANKDKKSEFTEVEENELYDLERIVAVGLASGVVTVQFNLLDKNYSSRRTLTMFSERTPQGQGMPFILGGLEDEDGLKLVRELRDRVAKTMEAVEQRREELRKKKAEASG